MTKLICVGLKHHIRVGQLGMVVAAPEKFVIGVAQQSHVHVERLQTGIGYNSIATFYHARVGRVSVKHGQQPICNRTITTVYFFVVFVYIMKQTAQSALSAHRIN